MTPRTQITVNVNVGPLKKIAGLIRAGVSGNGSSDNPIRNMLTKWGARYAAFIRRRFITNSRGGGEWPPLAASTIRRRRDGRRSKKQSRSVAILVNTGMLRDSLQPGAIGNVIKPVAGGVIYGIGSAAHPGGRATLGQLAIWHHTGAGKLPARTILVPPDEPTKEGMQADARQFVQELQRLNEGA